MTRIRPEFLETFVSTVDREFAGNLLHPGLTGRFGQLDVDFRTRVNQELSPYSDEYYRQQVALYEELSGRTLNQWDGELHPFDLKHLVTAPNPLGIDDSAHVAEHVRAVSSMLSISCLGHRPKILDMGAGHGLSSEVFAFCGCDVHSVDIDPNLAALSEQRSRARHLNITRSLLNFDDLSSIADHTYQGAYFFQSLHHCLRPWTLIDALRHKLVPGGIIGFAGEPIQTHWWKNWGIRLDNESLYVARKYGWFESGWSKEFITDCFAKAGMSLRLFSGGHGGGEIGLASTDPARLDEITVRAESVGYSRKHAPGDGLFSGLQFFSQIGDATKLIGAPAYQTKPAHQGGYLCYGPYIDLPLGRYRLSLVVERSSFWDGTPADPHLLLDVVSSNGTVLHLKEEIRCQDQSPVQAVGFDLLLGAPATKLEARVLVVGTDTWACSLPRLVAS